MAQRGARAGPTSLPGEGLDGGEPLLHLVRNAVDHGLETPDVRAAQGKPEVGSIRIEARRHKDSIEIEVADDGKGLDLASVCRRAIEAGLIHPDLVDDLPAEAIAAFVFHPGLSTARAVSDVSGRGVGMDAVKATIESLGGGVELRSEVGAGTATTLIVPITAAVQRGLVVGLGDERVAIPIGKVERILELPDDTARYLMARSKRDMQSLYQLLDRLDLEALRAQRRLTIPFVKNVLQSSQAER